LGVLKSYIHVAWFVSFPAFISQLICFFLILCTFFWVWGKKHGPLVFWELFLLFVGCFFFFFIYCVHAFELRARNTTPLFFGNFFFYLLVIFSFVLLYCVQAYQNQCYMCTKTSVIQWLASSGRLFIKKNSCNLDGVPIRHEVLETTCWDFGPRCWELKFLI
jgi:hypothetical protein